MSKRIVRSQSAEADALSGLRKSARAQRIAEGLLVPPFSLGSRAAGFFQYELEAVTQARAAGAGDDEIRALVRQLVADRSKVQAA